MKKIILGKTGLKVTKTAFGALPLQRVDMSGAIKLLRKAYAEGINFYDTARAYSNSEEKVGNALSDVRENIVIATKTHSRSTKEFWEHLGTSLEKLKTDYIDIYQFHNPDKVFMPNDGTGMYEAMLEAKSKGKIRHISITNHSKNTALEAIESGLYDTLQYPLSYISDESDLGVYKACTESGMGFIAMKALCGGLLTDAQAIYTFFESMESTVPIYGMQRESELMEFVELSKNHQPMTPEIAARIQTDKETLQGNFCRGCGYCLPCPSGIKINMAARMSFLLRRAVWQNFVTPEWQAEMRKVNDCIDCGKCKSRCPYGIDCPELMRSMLEDYEAFLVEKGI
jgi:aryl-alcohol dehydrogenase-like predicted oxidoreductase